MTSTITRQQVWPAGVREWLERFALAVREKDFEAGQSLFQEESQGFGTRATTTRNLRELMDLQWRVIWPNTEGFRFELDEVHAKYRISTSGDLCTVWLCWSSIARPRIKEQTGPFQRSGRCTIVLARTSVDEPWQAVHSHFSLEPVDENWERQLPPAS